MFAISGYSNFPISFDFATDDLPMTGTDVDMQLLEAAKAGDLDVVKVCHQQFK